MKFVSILLLVSLTFGHALQEVENLKIEEDRRELLVITGPAILAACISGAVGGIIGAVSTAGINACAGKRDKTIVIIRERDGTYREDKRDRRRELMGGKKQAAGGAAEENAEGILFNGNYQCPTDGKHTVVPLERDQDGTLALPSKYFDAEAYSQLDPIEQELFQKITPRSRWKNAIKQVIARNDAKKQMQKVQAEIKAKGSDGHAEYLQVASPNAKTTSPVMGYLPHLTFGVALLLLGGFAYRKYNDQKTYVYEELLDQETL